MAAPRISASRGQALGRGVFLLACLVAGATWHPKGFPGVWATYSGYPTCSADTAALCPTPTRYIYCLEGAEAGACRPSALGRFEVPYTCRAQCVWSADRAPHHACPWDVGNECPKSGRFFYCRDGKAKSGCRAEELGEFDAGDCDSQCLYDANAPVPDCQNGVGLTSPHDGEKYYYCREGPKHRKYKHVSEGRWSPSECHHACVYWSTMEPKNCPIGVGHECPTSEGSYYCRNGAAAGTCRRVTEGPFSIDDCWKQCHYDVNNPLRWCPDTVEGVGETCLKSNVWYFCSAGAAQGTCGYTPFKPSVCRTQCKLAHSSPQGECAHGVGDECPKDGKYFYCTSGEAKSVCRPYQMGDFPSAACASTCLYGKEPVPDMPPSICAAGVGTHCPSSGTWFVCTAGKAAGGCRALAAGNWPDGSECFKSCIYSAQETVPGECPPGVGTQCPTTGSYFFCQEGDALNGCRPTSSGLFPGVTCASQCVYTASSTQPLCSSRGADVGSVCPRDDTWYWYCATSNGCRARALGPFPFAECKLEDQCMVKWPVAA